jgi:hypothetical protein
MPLREYVVRLAAGLWEVRLSDRLLSGQPSYIEALSLAEALARSAASRGEGSKVLSAQSDGQLVELLLVEPDAI